MDYRYLPSVVFLFAPLAFLPHEIAKFICIWVSLVGILLGVVATRRSLATSFGNTALIKVPIILAGIATIKYFILSERYLNIHPVMTSLLILAAFLCVKGRWISASFAMAFAITIKIFPIFLLPYFVIKKQWSFVTLTVFLFVIINLLPAFYFGNRSNLELLATWREHVILNPQFHNLNGPINLSIVGEIERFTSNINYSESIADSKFENINFASLERSDISTITKTLQTAIFLLTLSFIWFADKRRTREGLSLKQIDSDISKFDSVWLYELSMFICMALMVGPRTNIIYFLSLFFPLAAFLYSLFTRPKIWKKLIFGFCIVITCLLPLIPGASRQRLLLVYGPEFFATFALWLSLGAIIIQETFIDGRRRLLEMEESCIIGAEMTLSRRGQTEAPHLSMLNFLKKQPFH